MNSLRSEVLSCFRRMHRARMEVFKGDIQMLAAIRGEINSQFRENQQLQDESRIEELITAADEACYYFKKSVVQMVETKADRLEVQVRPDLLYDELPSSDPKKKIKFDKCCKGDK